jgi:hypothetical protein
MATFGWVTFIFIGGYLAGKTSATLALVFVRGGLEVIPVAIAAGVFGAVAWVIFAWWISPFTISFKNT